MRKGLHGYFEITANNLDMNHPFGWRNYLILLLGSSFIFFFVVLCTCSLVTISITAWCGIAAVWCSVCHIKCTLCPCAAQLFGFILRHLMDETYDCWVYLWVACSCRFFMTSTQHTHLSSNKQRYWECIFHGFLWLRFLCKSWPKKTEQHFVWVKLL